MSLRFLDIVGRSPDQWIGAILRPNRAIKAAAFRLNPPFVAEIQKIVGDNGGRAHFTPDNQVVLFLRKDASGWIGTAEGEIRQACRKTAILVLAEAEAGAADIGMATLFYDLADDMEDFSRLIATMTDDDPRRRNARLGDRATRRATASLKLTAKSLAQLETILPELDIVSLIRHQWICGLIPGRDPIRVYRELFVSIDALRQIALPDVELRSERGLFQTLIGHLDGIVLGAFLKTSRSFDANFGINLTCDTILTPLFREFETLVRGSRVEMIVEIQAHEAVGDTTRFHEATRTLHAAGHKVCIDGLTTESAAVLRLDQLGADFLKLAAPPATQPSGDMARAIAASLTGLGPTRVILSRCEKEPQISTGQAAGVVLFQGWYPDALFEPAGKPAMAAAT